MERFELQRNLLKTDFKMLKSIQTDAKKHLPKPDAFKSYENSELIDLPDFSGVETKSVLDAISGRKSVRLYAQKDLTLTELSYLLWAVQGVTAKESNGTLKRTVPSAGATYTFETYIFVNNVDGLSKGIYRYIVPEHKLVCVKLLDDIANTMDEMTLEQPFVPHFAKKAAALFVWTTIPYRSEWKFDVQAHKKILIDAGHVCQNLYIAGEAADIGVCAIGIYDQEMLDNLLGVDGNEEFSIYLAAVGKKS